MSSSNVDMSGLVLPKGRCQRKLGEEEAATAALGGRDGCAGAAVARERQEVLDWAQACIDELVGLVDAKERFRLWRNAFEVSRRGVEHGGAVTSCAENQMVFLGAPGTAKRTFARVIGEVLFGWGTIARPGITEVSANDIIMGDLSRSAARRMKDVCDEARGGVLFFDEAYRLDPDTEDHSSCGVEAINTLQACMAAYRDELVVIVAGYARPMQEFLAAHVGLAGRFPVTVSFASYTPRKWLPLRVASPVGSTWWLRTRRGICCASKRLGCGRFHMVAARCSISPATPVMRVR
ncbi:AAA family ATPase [Mycobacterium malmoense]|uniref:AAA family ATPase n=1 Tax=Mycobacterium malmoense TaxID=1780 RepID=UPI00223C8C3C|nr:AAA family ATPase [Mycobacterium malmoense]UNB93293.1 AAA family ATPase [Mycobacterium malmoense]